MTNYEKIKNMSVEEMAHQLERIFSDGYDTDEYSEENCFGQIYLGISDCDVLNCHGCYKLWLESEVTND